MSTQTDFAALVVRIDAATDKLEVDVQQLEALINDAEGAISQELIDLRDQAKAAAAEAVVSAQQAANSATAASESATDANGSYIAAQGEVTKAIAQVALASEQVTLAAAQVQLAKDQVTLAQGQVAAATTQADRAKGIADTLLATAPFNEAPKDGSTYGRNNGDWVVVDVPEGSLVKSVNGVGPDGAGNVKLVIPTKTSNLTNDSGFITASDIPAPPVVPTKVSQLQNDTKFITLDQVPVVKVPAKTSELTNDKAFITAAEVPPSLPDAPSDGKQYARKDAAWSEVVSSGGGSGGGVASYTLPTDFDDDGTNVQRWFANHKLFPLVAYDANGWSDPKVLSQIKASDWLGDGGVPLETNPWNCPDIRLLTVQKVNKLTGVVVDTGYFGTTVNSSGDGVVSVGYKFLWSTDNTGRSGGYSVGQLPGRWFIPGSLMVIDETSQGLPTSMNGYDAIMEVVSIPMGSSIPRRHRLLTFWNLNKPTPSKMVYMYQSATATWVNIGEGTS